MKKIKVIDISGFRGLILIAYAIVCAVGGFIFFPAWAIMSLWNLFGTYVYGLPHMSLIHGFIMYAVFILFYFATTPDKPLLRFSSEKMSKSQIMAMMKDIEDKK